VRNINKKKNATYTLSTSEDPLWEQLDRYGPRGIRGEEVRMIDVPACVSDMRDIFDGEHAQAKVGETVEQRCRFVEDQERLTKTYQGEALRAYLAKRACDKTAKATLKRYMKEYTDHAPLPGQQRWLGRIQRLFAAVYAGAAQAIDYGVLPWGKKRTLTAIRACMADAMEKLIANSADDCERGRGSGQSDQSMLAEFNLRLPAGGRSLSLASAHCVPAKSKNSHTYSKDHFEPSCIRQACYELRVGDVYYDLSHADAWAEFRARNSASRGAVRLPFALAEVHLLASVFAGAQTGPGQSWLRFRFVRATMRW